MTDCDTGLNRKIDFDHNELQIHLDSLAKNILDGSINKNNCIDPLFEVYKLSKIVNSIGVNLKDIVNISLHPIEL